MSVKGSQKKSFKLCKKFKSNNKIVDKNKNVLYVIAIFKFWKS